MMSELEQMLSEARKYPGGSRKSLRIGALDSHRPETYLLDELGRFYEKRPDCGVEIESIPPEQLRKRLIEGELDVVFTVLYEQEYGYWPGCGMKTVRECPPVACMLPSNPLTKQDAVSVQDLVEMNLVVISPLYLPTYNQMLHDLFAGCERQPNIIYHTANASSQVYRLHDQRDVFICDQYHRDYDLESLAYRPITDTRSGVVMVWNENPQNPELRAFLELF